MAEASIGDLVESGKASKAAQVTTQASTPNPLDSYDWGPHGKPKWAHTYPNAKPIKVIFEESEGIPPTGQFVSVNGDAYMFVPGEMVVVPDFLLEHINNCVVGTPIVDARTQRVQGYRRTSRFPYRVVG